ncbi:tryptophan-rich sensory protein [Hasllibacter sp. MH4015]|uniref:tryptophan-rich sensory protein n=1 Tax=Hasllibacter sp. MH4015 TaxID=2854029 RepID=UPI001CD36AE9|nr:tryptophan-rich sensory protein [Hasllibacter sp. MH4015]
MTYMHVPPQTDAERDRARLWAILCLVAAVAFAIVPFFANPFSGFEPGQFPVPVDTPPIQPAGWAFSIWGVIYVWLIASTGYGLFQRADDARWAPHRPWAFASLAVGAAWIPVANASPVWATILILVMLVTALVAMAKAPVVERGWARWPLGLYAGWLTAASFVSLTNLAAGYGLASAELASWIALPLAVLTAAAITLRHWTPTYPAAAAWAAIGIAFANWPSGFAWGAATGAVLLAALVSLALARKL